MDDEFSRLNVRCKRQNERGLCRIFPQQTTNAGHVIINCVALSDGHALRCLNHREAPKVRVEKMAGGRAGVARVGVSAVTGIFSSKCCKNV